MLSLSVLGLEDYKVAISPDGVLYVAGDAGRRVRPLLYGGHQEALFTPVDVGFWGGEV